MIDKPEKKTPKPRKVAEKKEEKTIEEVPEKAEATEAEEKPAPTAHKQEGTPLVLEPKEVITATVEPSIEELTIPTPKTLDEQLLDFYNAAEPGNLSLGQIMVQLGVDDPILIKQAWDRLYDLHKVPFSKLFKPPMGFVGFEP